MNSSVQNGPKMSQILNDVYDDDENMEPEERRTQIICTIEKDTNCEVS